MSKKQKIGKVVCITGASSCLLVALVGLVMITYWHHVTNDWLDDHIFFWQPIGIACIGGVFFFTRIVASIFDV
jgi:hypothetical protein